VQQKKRRSKTQNRSGRTQGKTRPFSRCSSSVLQKSLSNQHGREYTEFEVHATRVPERKQDTPMTALCSKRHPRQEMKKQGERRSHGMVLNFSERDNQHRSSRSTGQKERGGSENRSDRKEGVQRRFL